MAGWALSTVLAYAHFHKNVENYISCLRGALYGWVMSDLFGQGIVLVYFF